jgi:ribosomal protein S18 acetylase RimI-like enzyme
LDYLFRELKEEEYPLLRDFTYESIFQRDENNPLPRDIVDTPLFLVFYENFGQADDCALAAEADGAVVGAVWTRITRGAVKGFGHVDDQTPEFAIAVLKPYCGAGIGAALMGAMLARLRERGYARASLSVQRDNYAVRLYERAGFRVLRATDEEYIMVCDL